MFYCVISSDCVDESGLYYDSCKVKKLSVVVHDKEFVRKFWEKSVEWIGVFEFPL